MSVNLIELLKEQIGSQVASQSSRFLGEEESKVSTSLDLILPALLGGFMKNKANEGFYNSAKDTEDGILENLKSLFAGGPSTTNLMNSGDVIIKTIIGDKFNSLLNVISTETGLKKGSASSLLRMIAPLMLHAIGK